MKKQQLMRDVEAAAIVCVWLLSALVMVAVIVSAAARWAW
jgi:hypothetical protein